MIRVKRELPRNSTSPFAPASAAHAGTFQARAHGHAAGPEARMTRYTAGHQGTPTRSEVAGLIWLTYADRDRVSPVDQVIFDHLHRNGQLA